MRAVPGNEGADEGVILAQDTEKCDSPQAQGCGIWQAFVDLQGMVKKKKLDSRIPLEAKIETSNADPGSE